jgi:hypothetical protein
MTNSHDCLLVRHDVSGSKRLCAHRAWIARWAIPPVWLGYGKSVRSPWVQDVGTSILRSAAENEEVI